MNNVHFAIPEIYGETLSYYELLRKLVDKTNDLIDNYNTVPEQIAEAVANLDIFNQLIDSIATDNTKSTNAVKVYKKHDLLYATFNKTVNLYESLIDFRTGTELIVGTNIREVNISELFIELRTLIADEASAREHGETTLQQAINTERSAREDGETTLQQAINTERSAREQADNLKVNKTDILSLEQIKIAENLNGKTASASALKNVNELFGNIKFVYQPNVPVKFTSSRTSDALTAPENAIAILSVNAEPPGTAWTYTYYNNQFKIKCVDQITFDRSFNMNIVWACTQ